MTMERDLEIFPAARQGDRLGASQLNRLRNVARRGDRPPFVSTPGMQTEDGIHYSGRARAKVVDVFWAQIEDYDSTQTNRHSWKEVEWINETWQTKEDGLEGSIEEDSAWQVNGFSAMPGSIVELKKIEDAEGEDVYVFSEAHAFWATITECDKDTGECLVTPNFEPAPPALRAYQGVNPFNQVGDKVKVSPIFGTNPGCIDDVIYEVTIRMAGFQFEEPEDAEVAPHSIPPTRDYCTGVTS